MNKQQALEVVVEVLKRTPISVVESYGVNQALDVLRYNEPAKTEEVKPGAPEKKEN